MKDGHQKYCSEYGFLLDKQKYCANIFHTNQELFTIVCILRAPNVNWIKQNNSSKQSWMKTEKLVPETSEEV